MSTISDEASAYEWAEFNLPIELSDRPHAVSPLARRLFAASTRKVEPQSEWPFDRVHERIAKVGVVSALFLRATLARP
jgi:hypothetical protein